MPFQWRNHIYNYHLAINCKKCIHITTTSSTSTYHLDLKKLNTKIAIDSLFSFNVLTIIITNEDITISHANLQNGTMRIFIDETDV